MTSALLLVIAEFSCSIIAPLHCRDGGAAGGGAELRLAGAGRGEDHQDHGPVGL